MNGKHGMITLQQARDFAEECEALDAPLRSLAASDWTKVTQFKGWTLNDVLVHLHFWNRMADLSLTDPDVFAGRAASVLSAIGRDGFRATENAAIPERGEALRKAWIGLCRDMGARWASLDPKQRVSWVGPDMSVRSSMTARQMETWAHGQEIFDILGLRRTDTDRIRNIVMLGVNTFGWSFKVHGRQAPDAMPRLELTAPSGALWRFGEDGPGRISGSAVDFARVVTQTRNVADTGLVVEGEGARQWMAIAQCFAGGPERPPAAGLRHRVGDGPA